MIRGRTIWLARIMRAYRAMTPPPSPVLGCTPPVSCHPSRPELPAPRVLLFFLSAQDSYRRPLFSPQEVFCGPDTAERSAGGRITALATPVGSCDAGAVAARLPGDQQPELIVVKADATARNFPRNLSRFKCPRVLLVGDTHHLRAPLQTVLRYAREEPFDFIILDHTRHHAEWFHRAGFNHVFWLPALDYGFEPRPLAAAPTHALTFVGQAGLHHPYRRHVLDRIRAAGLPLEVLSGPLAHTADLYADSRITLNISLNGDLNLRVFEALAAGGFLLTDELSAASGLPLLFNPGEHLVTWRTPGELIEKIRHFEMHPDEARRIRRAGQAEMVRAHHPDVKLREFYDLVYSGRVNPRYSLQQEERLQVAGFEASGDPLLPAYELVQSLHQGSEGVEIFCAESDMELLKGLADLPRVRVLPLTQLAGLTAEPMASPPPGGLPEHHVLWWTDADESALPSALARFRGRHIVAPAALAGVLADWGYTAAGHGLYEWADAGRWLQSALATGVESFSATRLAFLLTQADAAQEALTIAELAGQMEAGPLYKEALMRAIFLDRNCVPAYLQLASLSLDLGEQPSAALLLAEAARSAPLPPAIESLRTELLTAHAHHPDVAAYLAETGPPAGATAAPRCILLVTNLFPPEELGGYGRMMWEFAHGLKARGHEVHVLCGQAPYLRKPPTEEEAELETFVARELALLGEWREGVARPVGAPAQLARLAAANARRIVGAALAFGADLVLLGNMDFLGTDFLAQTLAAGFPVLHALANAAPGYQPAEQPDSPRYSVAPCSDWNGTVFRRAGFAPASLRTLYPGARLENFTRHFFPDTRRLRIAYASLVMPYKGAHILVQALGRLHRAGFPFTAEIAGDSTDPAFLANLQKFVGETGMADRVRFTGFLDRPGLAALFARSNVLVFPSQFDEPFGISQVEALAAGLVVVTSGTGGAAEIIRDGVDGLRFPAPDSAALAQRLALLAGNPSLFQELQRNGRRRARDFSVDTAVREIEGRMDVLCGEPAVQISA